MKKVVVTYKDGTTVTYQSRNNVPDTYYLMQHDNANVVVSITKQYYPLKNNPVEYLFRNTLLEERMREIKCSY